MTVPSAAASPPKTTNYWSSRSKHSKTLLPVSFVPGPYSVVLGRTKFCFDSVGNRRFRVTAKMFLDEYREAGGKAEKSRIVSRVYSLIQEASPEGAFVTFQNGRWYECSERISREKIGALFRDLLSDKYKSSSKAKQAKKHALLYGQQRQHHTATVNNNNNHSSNAQVQTRTSVTEPTLSFYDVDDSSTKHSIDGDSISSDEEDFAFSNTASV